MKNKYIGDSRSDQRAKRRKTNLILNSLIAIVLLLIIFVSFSIFFSDGNKANTTSGEVATDTNDETKTKDDSNVDEEAQTNQEEETTVPENEQEQTEDQSQVEETVIEDEAVIEPETDNVVTEGGRDPNVKSTIVNPNWKPIGTSQTGEHVAVYDGNSVDWQEMVQAISYGTGIDRNNMTVWFLGNNGTNQSIATVSTKDQTEIYRVSIEWVDNQGWKPVRVEQLIKNDRM